jgi:hypothetical protein
MLYTASLAESQSIRCLRAVISFVCSLEFIAPSFEVPARVIVPLPLHKSGYNASEYKLSCYVQVDLRLPKRFQEH